MDNERHPGRMFKESHLEPQAALTQHVTVVGREDDDGVVGKAELVEAAFWRACPLAPEDFDEVSSRTVYTGKDDPASNEEAVAQWCLTVKDADEQKVGRGVFNAMNELALASIPGFFAARSGSGARAFGVHRAGLVPAGLVPPTRRGPGRRPHRRRLRDPRGSRRRHRRAHAGTTVRGAGRPDRPRSARPSGRHPLRRQGG